MAKYAKVTIKAEAKPELPSEPRTPRNVHQVQRQLSELGPKIRDILSSPSQRKYNSL
jgi:hypothetical protein